MPCVQCGKRLSAKAKFCPSCGAAQLPPQSEAPADPWQARTSVGELLGYFDKNPGLKAVDSFVAHVIPKGVPQRLIEGRPYGTFIVLPEYVYYLTGDPNKYGTDPTAKVLKRHFDDALAVAGVIKDMGSLLGIAKRLGQVTQMWIDGAFSNDRQVEAMIASPNSLIIPMRAIERIEPLANPLSGLPQLEIVTREGSYLVSETRSIHEQTQPPHVQVVKFAWQSAKDAIYGWRPELVQFLKDAVAKPKPPAAKPKAKPRKPTARKPSARKPTARQRPKRVEA